MHYVHIAGPETYKAAIMIAKMLNDILYGKVVVFHPQYSCNIITNSHFLVILRA